MATITICSDFGAQNILIILEHLLWRGQFIFNLTKFIHIISSTWRYNLLHRLPPIITLQTRIPGIIEKASEMKYDTILDISDWATSRSLSRIGEGNGNHPLQCSCVENPRDGGAWWAAVYGVAQSWTRLKWLSSSRSFLLNSQNGSHIDPQPYSFFSHQSRSREGLALGIKILKLTVSSFSPSL